MRNNNEWITEKLKQTNDEKLKEQDGYCATISKYLKLKPKNEQLENLQQVGWSGLCNDVMAQEKFPPAADDYKKDLGMDVESLHSREPLAGIRDVIMRYSIITMLDIVHQTQRQKAVARFLEFTGGSSPATDHLFSIWSWRSRSLQLLSEAERNDMKQAANTLRVTLEASELVGQHAMEAVGEAVKAAGNSKVSVGA